LTYEALFPILAASVADHARRRFDDLFTRGGGFNGKGTTLSLVGGPDDRDPDPGCGRATSGGAPVFREEGFDPGASADETLFFVTQYFFNRAVGLPLYFAGQFLIVFLIRFV